MSNFPSLDSQLSIKERRCLLSLVDENFDSFITATCSKDITNDQAGLCLEEFWKRFKQEFSCSTSEKKCLMREVFLKVISMAFVERKQGRRLQEALDKIDSVRRETTGKFSFMIMIFFLFVMGMMMIAMMNMLLVIS